MSTPQAAQAAKAAAAKPPKDPKPAQSLKDPQAAKPPKAPDASRRSERSRQAILDASMELVGEVGYNKLTIEAIASRAGVGKQTIYRWWPSKAAVLLDAFLSVVHDNGYDDGIPDTGDLEADLKAVLRATVDEFVDAGFEAPYRALAIAGASDAELAREFSERLQEPGLAVYQRRLRAAQEAGQIAEDLDLDLAIELLLSPFQQRWLTRSGPLTYAFTDRLVEMALRAFR